MYILFFLELVIDESFYDTGLPGSAVSQEDDFVGFLAQSRTSDWRAHPIIMETYYKNLNTE